MLGTTYGWNHLCLVHTDPRSSMAFSPPYLETYAWTMGSGGLRGSLLTRLTRAQGLSSRQRRSAFWGAGGRGFSAFGSEGGRVSESDNSDFASLALMTRYMKRSLRPMAVVVNTGFWDPWV